MNIKKRWILFLSVIGIVSLTPWHTANATIADFRFEIGGISYHTPISEIFQTYGARKCDDMDARRGDYRYRWKFRNGPTMQVNGENIDGEILACRVGIAGSKRWDGISTMDGVCIGMPIKVLEEVYGKPDYILTCDYSKHEMRLKDRLFRKYIFLSDSGELLLIFTEDSNKRVWTGIIESMDIVATKREKNGIMSKIEDKSYYGEGKNGFSVVVP